MNTEHLRQFLIESNKIEGITREIMDFELAEVEYFIGLEVIGIENMKTFVDVFEPGAVLRDKPGMDVRVGNHTPPPGGPGIVRQLKELLDMVTIGQGDIGRRAACPIRSGGDVQQDGRLVQLHLTAT